MMFWICVALAVVAGVGSALQGPANAAVARSWDLSRSIALNGAVVFVGAAIGMLLFRTEMPAGTTRPPWIHMIGGLCGLLFISVAAFSVPRIGASVFTAAMVLGMVAASLLTDHFGWFGQTESPITPVRLIGVALIVVGVALVRLTATQS
jgi:bacterial/archaeal transporter family-2 protein